MHKKQNIPDSVNIRFEEQTKFAAQRDYLKPTNIEALLQYEDVYFGKRIANVNKVHKFINRLKIIDEKAKPAILKDAETYNLTNFLEETANAISICTITRNDILFFMELCSLLHQEYENFGKLIANALIKQIISGGGLNEIDRQAVRRRNLLRLLCELHIIGVSVGQEKVFEGLKSALLNKEMQSEFIQQNVISALEFVQNFHQQFFGQKSQILRKHCEQYGKHLVLNQLCLPPEVVKKLNMWFNQIYIIKLKSILDERFQTLIEVESKNQKRKKEYGILQPEEEQEYTDLLDKYNEFKDQIYKIMGEINIEEKIEDRDAKLIVKDAMDRAEEQRKKEIQASYQEEIEVIDYIFKDESNQSLYENIIDLKKMVPEILLQAESQETIDKEEERWQQGEIGFSDNEDEEEQKQEEQKEQQDFVMTKYKQCSEKLAKCDTIRKANDLAIDFCYINSYVNRKRLIIDVLNKYDKQNYKWYLPYRVRVLIILQKYFPNISDECQKILLDNFQQYRDEEKFNQNNQINCLLLCEFVKFGIIQGSVLMNCMKTYIDTLNGVKLDYLIDIAQSCGVYLMLRKENKMRFQMMMSFLQKKKEDKSIFTDDRVFRLKAALETIKNSKNK